MINNNIQEDYCSFEVCKLLKEKGFDIPCSTHWELGNGDKKSNTPPGVYIGGFLDKQGSPRPYNNSELMESYQDERYPNDVFGEWSRPTHSVAIEWIRVNFGIHIWIASKDVDGKEVLYIGNARNIPVKKDKKGFIIDPLPYNPKSTPQEATEAALLYTLQNFINKN